MNKKLLRKIISLSLSICFSLTTFSLPVFAAQGKQNNRASSHHSRQILEPNIQKTHSSIKQRPSSAPRLNNSINERKPFPSKPNGASRQPGPRVHRPSSSTGGNLQKVPSANRPTSNNPISHHPKAHLPRPNSSVQRPHRPSLNRPYNRPNRPVPSPHRVGPRRPMPRPHYRPYPYWRRSGIIFHFGYPRAHFWWGCRRGLSFGDYLLIAMIVSAARQATMDDVYNRHLNGESYETICNSYDVDWYTINTNARTRYSQMNMYATNRGISFWSWSDILSY